MTGFTRPLRIALLDDYQGVAASLGDWSRLGPHEVVAFRDHLADEDSIVERLRDFTVVVAMRERTPFPRTLLERLPALELLVTTGPRNAAIDLRATAELGIPVCGTRISGGDTAELTWALILSLARDLPGETAGLREGAWQRGVGVALAGRTLGVLGLGKLGTRVARVGLAFGMEVIAWSENLTAERAAEVGVERVEKRELFERADVLSVHLVLSNRTRGLVGRLELDAMKPTAFLVNTSRAPIIDEAALLETLRTRGIAGAALDVFEIEPLPAAHPLRDLPGVILTPHIGYVTDNAYRIFFDDVVEDIEAFAAGAPVRLVELN